MCEDQTVINAHIEFSEDNTHLRLNGDWTLQGMVRLVPQVKQLVARAAQEISLDASGVDKMDSAGALLLDNILAHFQQLGKQAVLAGLHQQYQSLLKLFPDGRNCCFYLMPYQT